MARKPIFREGYPKIEVEKTEEGGDGTFLSSGKVVFALEDGPSLSFPFAKAKSRDDAMRQAVDDLAWFLSRFDRALKSLRPESPQLDAGFAP